ncbi:hypothetical protein [Streptacidiphilus sp. MAP5-52]|uniref:hypothetical protein n=1 Tax=Streptacidiphilus sp. MAP5-52 TaxID=3156267 RepID=UPI0035183868
MTGSRRTDTDEAARQGLLALLEPIAAHDAVEQQVLDIDASLLDPRMHAFTRKLQGTQRPSS